MISVQEAIAIVQKSVTPSRNSEWKHTGEAVGCVLFDSLRSPIDMPPFRQSAMDGYALCLNHSSTYTIIGEVKAGDNSQPTLKQGEAVRIFTGAAVPDTANAVIMQEKVVVEEDMLKLETPVSMNDNIRPRGEQVKENQLALQSGTLLSPASCGFIASLGITQVKVYARPRIAIVVTGNELATPGKKLAYGQIYESNALMLEAALGQLGYETVHHFKVADHFESTLGLLESVISDHDLIVISGGISVGDYDFVGTALQELNVKPLFYKVKQKPGKPLYFGKLGEALVFALPGNPAAALSCFYVYLYPALQKIGGLENFGLLKTKARSNSSYEKKGDRALFLKAIYNGDSVEILEGQSSAMLQTFALANALVYIPEDGASVQKDELVEVVLLPLN